MATQKQRKRRAKEKRHDYDLVEIDAEGNETVLTATDVRPNDPPARVKGDAKPGRRQPAGGRAVQPASWKRVLRRGMIFAPIMFLTLLLIGGDTVTPVGALANTVVLMGVFIPFSYLMDRLLYRQYEKRRARETGG